MTQKKYRELYYKDMSEEGLKKLEEYGFVRKQEDYSIWWQYPANRFELWLNVEYWTDPTTEYDSETQEVILIEPSELVKCNGEFGLGINGVQDIQTVESIETICKLYQDGLVEFRDTTGSSYELMKEKQRGLCNGE